MLLDSIKLTMRVMTTQMLSKSVNTSMVITCSDPPSARDTSLKAAVLRSRNQSPKVDFSYARESMEEI